MNKIIYFLLSLFLCALFIPSTAFATSGACSGHGGVDCSAGRDWDGSVICNDGWTGSSVSYSSMVMCQGYSSSYTSTPSCPSNSSYDSYSDSCKCYSGYVVKNGSCISGLSYCIGEYGWGSSYNSLSKSCECDPGYFLSSGTCVTGLSYCQDQYGYGATYDHLSDKCGCSSGYQMYQGECVSNTSYCTQSWGLFSSYNSLKGSCECDRGYKLGKDASGGISCVSGSTFCSQVLGSFSTYDSIKDTCTCRNGYLFDGSRCVEKTCPEHASLSSDDSCMCDTGYITDASKTACVPIACSSSSVKVGDSCVSGDAFCLNLWPNSSFNVVTQKCECNTGYDFDSVANVCAKKVEVQAAQTPAVAGIKISAPDAALTARMKGRILLQTESHGEAWYVNPKDGKRYYMKDGAVAYQMMRNFGLGITDADLTKIPEQNDSFSLPNSLKNLKGKILLQVQQRGEAWYVHPDTGKRYYMKDGDAAYQLMRLYSLGISNDNLGKIVAGE